MPLRLFTALCVLALSAVAEARDPQLKLPAFSHLQSQAVESVNVTFGSVPLTFARWFLVNDDADSAELRSLLKGVKSMTVAHYEFASDFVYSKDDIEAVRTQLSDSGWSQIVQVRNKGADEAVDVYLSLEKDKITGLAVVASEPREFTIVNIVGSLDMDKVRKLRARIESDRDAPGFLWDSESGL
jgi:hypothetical protein